jgi:hypothetical protein
MALSVLLPKVVPPLVAVEDLTRSSSEVELEHHMEELELAVSEALGISLSEVHAQYFQDTDSSEHMEQVLDDERKRQRWLAEWAEEQRVEHWTHREDVSM